MVEIEPDLPEPPTEPATFLASSTDSPFVQRGLLPRRIEVDDGENACLWSKDIVDAIEQGIKAWDLS